MVDAMIFIVILGIVSTLYFSYDPDDGSPSNDASDISDKIFLTKLHINDLVDSNDTGLISISDLIVFQFSSDDQNIKEYLKNVLDSILQRSGSYCLELSYGDHHMTIGSEGGYPVSHCHREHTVTFGGTLVSELWIY